jgi:hypothetical protein
MIAVGTILVVALLVAGVAVASTSKSVPAQVKGEAPAVVLEQLTVEEGKPTLSVVGSGFAPYEIALVEVLIGGGKNPIILGGKMVTDAASFNVKAALGTAVTPGIYTIRATGTGGSIASTPLIVVKKKE